MTEMTEMTEMTDKIEMIEMIKMTEKIIIKDKRNNNNQIMDESSKQIEK
ncbi:unnamed protein product [Paramecium sonneborni]|uniref:Uncharacterized protein n=1 Tax=Paramecium sonneborni TaxID=65129 RepID=A0A8S1RKD1_9CILI|nr:unnamed protein product [Paramecium sonneborni]